MVHTPNAIIYCRVSSVGQLDGGGLNSQEVTCRQYCERNGYKVINIFYDSFTGGDLDRPGLNKLFAFIEESEKTGNKVDIFIAEDISRIARDYSVHLELTKGLLKRGVKYETVNMKFEDTPAGKMIEGMMAIYSEYFRRSNQQQVINRQEARLLDGYRPRAPPLGYKTVRAESGGKLLVPDEPNASIIKKALEGYANNLLDSVKDVADFLQRKGLELKEGENIVHPSLAHRLLNNVLYSGMIIYNKTTMTEDGIIKKERNIPLRKGKHEGIISFEIYNTIQQKLNGKRPYIHEIKVINEEYPLRGFIVCTCCELPFSSGKSRSKSGAQLPYYQFNRKCLNKGKSVNANKLHQTLDVILKELSISKEFLAFMKVLIEKEFQERNKDKELNKKNVAKEISIIDGEINKLVLNFTNATSPTLQVKIEQMINQKEGIKNQLVNELLELQEDQEIGDIFQLAFEILFNPHYVRTHGTIDQKQMLLRLLFNKKIPVDYATKTYGTLPFTSLFLYSKDVDEANLQKLESGGINSNHTRLSENDYESLFTLLINQSKYINAIYKIKEMQRLI